MGGISFWLVLAGLFYLLLLPILTFISLARSGRHRDEIILLRKNIQGLQQRLQELHKNSPRGVTPPKMTAPEGVSASVSPAMAKTTAISTTTTVVHETVAPSPTPWSAQQNRTSASNKPDVQKKPKENDVFAGLLGWFIQGNPLAKLGVMLLFFGLAYLLKYSAEHGMLPVELRLCFAAAVSGGLLYLGWRLRRKHLLYALILQGGSIGALYITVFGAFRLYQLLPHTLAFGLMLVICAASIGLAVLQRALSLAMLASLGGYLSPIILSSGGGSYVALFSYYLLLSLGILAISVWQPWRPLNLLGFIFTFSVAGLWGAENYVPTDYLPCQLLLIANVLIFGVFSVILTLRSQRSGEKIIDGVLLFGTPLIGFGMQYAITEHWVYGAAFSSLGFGLTYLLLATVALKRYQMLGKPLAVPALILGGIFTTLAIPLSVSEQWTSMAWALEGAGIFWLGVSQRKKQMCGSGIALLLLAACYAIGASVQGVGIVTFALVFAVQTLAWLVSAQLLRQSPSDDPLIVLLVRCLLAGGIGFWVTGIIGFVHHLPLTLQQALFLFLAMLSLSVLLWHQVSKSKNWAELQLATWLLWPAMFWVALTQTFIDSSLLDASWLNIVWIFVLTVAFRLLKNTTSGFVPTNVLEGLHLSLFWILLFMASTEIYRRTASLSWGMDEWRVAIPMFYSALVIFSIHFLIRKSVWPFVQFPTVYGLAGVSPLAVFGAIWLFTSNVLDGVIPGLQFVPLLNPLEESAGFLSIALFVWISALRSKKLPKFEFISNRVMSVITMATVLWWGNGLLLRILSYYADIGWNFNSLWNSRLVQTTFALVWTMLALIVMVAATSKQKRSVWFYGSGLLGVVILKLFLVDSARGGGLARAISFIGVAILVLVVGYFSPLPPKSVKSEACLEENK